MNATQYPLNNNDAVKINYEFVILSDPNTIGGAWPRGNCFTCARAPTGEFQGQYRRTLNLRTGQYDSQPCWYVEQLNWNSNPNADIYTSTNAVTEAQRILRTRMQSRMYGSVRWFFVRTCPNLRDGRGCSDACGDRDPAVV
jgi:hypothetical protein